MKIRLPLMTVMLCACLCIPVAHAQKQAQQGIVQHIIESSDSTVSIDLSPSLAKDFEPALDKSESIEPEGETKPHVSEGNLTDRPGKKVATRTNGFRIQIFSDGRDQNTLQARARARAKRILARFPKYNHQVYSFSKSPNYYTRIGNFATRSEATAALNQLRRAFPEFAGEMRVVASEVIITR